MKLCKTFDEDMKVKGDILFRQSVLCFHLLFIFVALLVISFMINVSISANKLTRVLNGVALNLYIYLENTVILTFISSNP